MPSAEAFAASWAQLKPWERAALGQLSVFRGSFSLEAAERVISLQDFPSAPWSLDVVQALTDGKLLATAATDDSGALRFELAQAVRAQAVEQLAAMGPTCVEAAGARHAAWMLDWARAQVLLLQTQARSQALAALERERENLIAIAERGLATPDGGAAALAAEAREMLAALMAATP